MAKKPSKTVKPADSALLGGAASAEGTGGRKQAERLREPAPKRLDRIYGQDRAAALIGDALRSGRVHHSWIFYGDTGVGKFTVAMAIAAMLLDPTLAPSFSGELMVEEESQTQRLLADGVHPDLVVIRKELARFHEEKQIRDSKQKSISIEVVRQFLLEPGALAPSVRTSSIAGRVFIIDDADLLNLNAQNALLKFLEEPPERTVIIMVTSAEDRLLPTIRSRSQRVFFPRLRESAMQKWFEARNKAIEAAGGNPAEVDVEKRNWLLAFAAGSPGIFEAALGGGLAEWWAQLQPLLAGIVQGRYVVTLGPVMGQLVAEWAENAVGKNPNASKEAANQAAADWMFRLLASFFTQRMKHLPPCAESEACAQAIDLIRAAEREMDANVTIPFVFEKLSAEFASVFAAVVGGGIGGSGANARGR